MLNTPAIPHKVKDNTVDSDTMDHLDSSPLAMRARDTRQSPFAASSVDRVDDSPLSRFVRRKNHSRQKTRSVLSTFSEPINNWFSHPSSSGLVAEGATNELLTPIRLTSDDPFTGMYSAWVKEPQSAKGKDGLLAQLSSPGEESPVLRNSQLREERMVSEESNLIGLGIGLMAPFTFTSEDFQTREEFSDDYEGGNFGLTYPPSPEDERDAAEVDDALASSGPPGLQNFGLRRAHTFMSHFETHNGDEPYEPLAPPLKRRRTIDTHG
jgi:hypothetical protein